MADNREQNDKSHAAEGKEGAQPKPSQAEGDEKTVDESIKQHERKGDLKSK